MKKKSKAIVGVIMGSKNDMAVMGEAVRALEEFKIPFEVNVVSAHRTPDFMFKYAHAAAERGIQILIAGAGGAAHLPGMVASLTHLPVLGVPISVGKLKGLDALLSIAQMPKGVPVGCLAVDNAYNAGLLAARFLGTTDSRLAKALKKYSTQLKKKVLKFNR